MKFNSIDLSDYGLIAKRSPVPYMPPVGIEHVQVGDKGHDFRAYLQPKIISLDVVISSATLEADLDSLSKLLNPVLGLKELVLDKPDDRYYLAKVSGGFEYQFMGSKIAVGSIQFVCPDPMAYDNDEVGAGNDYAINADPKTIEETTEGTGYILPVYTLTAGEDLFEEKQESYNASYTLYSGAKTRLGQKLTINSRTVSKLKFYLAKTGSPTGNVTFTIRATTTDGGHEVDEVILTKVWGDAADLPADIAAEKEVTFDTPTFINEEVRISVEFSGGDVSNCIFTLYRNTDVKAGEGLTYYAGSWTDEDGNGNDYDCAYKCTFSSITIEVENTDTEEEIVWKGVLANTEELEIDVAKWIVKKEGVVDMATVSGQFPRLLPGQVNNIKVTGFGILGSLNITYRNRFL